MKMALVGYDVTDGTSRKPRHLLAASEAIKEEELEIEEEELDPRVQTELEKLNYFTDEINKLELLLEETNSVFRSLLTDSTQQLKATSSRLGSACIEKARPYYEALELSNKAQKECQSAATHYQRASGVHAAAKETITLAEQRFLSNSNDWAFDNAWQEMLNHATIKVMEAEKVKTESEAEHGKRAIFFRNAEAEVQRLSRKLKRYISKSRPYFEEKELFNKALGFQKEKVQDLQERIKNRKAEYAKSLHNLEEISESIHARRQQRLQRKFVREPGVGSEMLSEQELNHDLDLKFAQDRKVSSLSSFSTDEDYECASSPRRSISGKSVSSSLATTIEESDMETFSAKLHDPATPVRRDQILDLTVSGIRMTLECKGRTMSCPVNLMNRQDEDNKNCTKAMGKDERNVNDPSVVGIEEEVSKINI